jgi:aminopeptidase 2
MATPERPGPRLPKNVSPLAYTLTYDRIDLEAPFRLEGTVDITLEVRESTQDVCINAHELWLEGCTLTQGEVTQEAESILQYRKEQVAVLRFPSAVLAGAAELNIKFVGCLNSQLAGFYRSKYTGLDGKEKYMATTQFEPADARRAFPCFDEPSLKVCRGGAPQLFVCSRVLSECVCMLCSLIDSVCARRQRST